VNDDADVREITNPQRLFGFRAQGSKQGKECCAAEVDLYLMGTSVALIDATYGHLSCPTATTTCAGCSMNTTPRRPLRKALDCLPPGRNS
jgi:hypothetical protein